MAKSGNTPTATAPAAATGQTAGEASAEVSQQVADAENTGAEGTGAEEKPKKEKIEKVAFLAEGADKLTELTVPGGFDPKIHLALNGDDFVNEHTWLRYKSQRLKDRAAKYDAEADISEKLGDSDSRAKASRIIKMMSAIEKTKNELVGSGSLSEADLEEMIAALSGDAPAEE